MASNSYNLFNQVNPSTIEWVVKVEVLSVWEVFNIKENTPKTLDFIMMDANVSPNFPIPKLHEYYNP